jgi:hypothetical protein
MPKGEGTSSMTAASSPGFQKITAYFESIENADEFVF